MAVRDREDDILVKPGIEAARQPGQHPGGRVQLGPGGQVVCQEGHRIAIGVQRAQRQFQQFALGHDLVAHGEQDRGCVAVAHGQGQRDLVPADGAGAAIAVILHDHLDRVRPRLACRRGPVERGRAIADPGNQRGPLRQPLGGEGERIAIGIDGADR